MRLSQHLTSMVNIEQLNKLEERLTELIDKEIKTERDRAEAREETLQNKISELEKVVETQSSTLVSTIKTWVGSLTDSIDKANMAIGALTFRLDNEEQKLIKEREVDPLGV